VRAGAASPFHGPARDTRPGPEPVAPAPRAARRADRDARRCPPGVGPPGERPTDRLYACRAGPDVHKATAAARARTATAGGRVRREVRTFGTTTDDRPALADRPAGIGVTHVAMESTGVYRKPVFHLLEGRLEVLSGGCRPGAGRSGRRWRSVTPYR